VQDLIPLIPATAYRPVTVDGQTYWTFSRTLRIPGLGKVRLVISFQKADLTGTYVVLVTNRLDWSAQRIIAAYLGRWPIETFYQDGKGLLGLVEYRMRNAEAIRKHGCLVFSWPIRSCTWIACHRYRRKVTRPAKPSGRRVANKLRR